jgi:ABC-type enterochelin transport system substrate-binding protein
MAHFTQEQIAELLKAAREGDESQALNMFAAKVKEFEPVEKRGRKPIYDHVKLQDVVNRAVEALKGRKISKGSVSNQAFILLVRENPETIFPLLFVRGL